MQTLKIDALVHGGLGISRTPDGVVFVSGALPGETVRVRLTGKKARCVFTEAIEILEPSPHRRAPFCPLFGVCGGCDWQHLTPEYQSSCKRDIFLDCLRRQGKIDSVSDLHVFCAAETGYRIRARFQVDPAKQIIGFMKRASNTIVDIPRCPLLAEPLNDLLAALHSRSSDIPPETTIAMAITGTDSSIAIEPHMPSFGTLQAHITIARKTFAVRGGSFFQNNRFLVEQLATWAAPHLEGDTCVDLYGGAGLFSALLADRFSNVELVELEPSLAAFAAETFRANGLSHCRAVTASAEDFFRRSRRASGSVDCLIVDPPRQGLTRQVLTGIQNLRPATLLYVSCDPATQARDLGFLTRECGYTIGHAALFDLYPNTHHVETEVILTLS